MKKLKIFLVLFVMLGVVICLAGCDSNNNNQNSNTTTNTNKSASSNKSSNTQNTTKKQSNSVEDIDFVAGAEKQVANPNKGETIAIMHIKNYGDIKIKFFNDVAPKAVENFITHARNGYYNGVTFHRVINEFMIQGGDPTGTGRGGQSIWGSAFEDEFSYDLLPYRGALCMANSGTNTNGSQFFIEQANYSSATESQYKKANYPENLLKAYKKYGGNMHLFGVHTVFGQVFEGMDVVDKIANTETDSNDKPVQDVVIESIEIVEY